MNSLQSVLSGKAIEIGNSFRAVPLFHVLVFLQFLPTFGSLFIALRLLFLIFFPGYSCIRPNIPQVFGLIQCLLSYFVSYNIAAPTFFGQCSLYFSSFHFQPLPLNLKHVSYNQHVIGSLVLVLIQSDSLFLLGGVLNLITFNIVTDVFVFNFAFCYLSSFVPHILCSCILLFLTFFVLANCFSFYFFSPPLTFQLYVVFSLVILDLHRLH